MTAVGGGGYRGGRFWDQPDALLGNTRATQKAVDWCNCIMVHNGYLPKTLNVKGKRIICMYHSEPHRVDRSLERRGVQAYVIAQGHALLYPGLAVLPNLVDIYDPLMRPPADRREPDGKVRIGFSPSNRHGVEYMRKYRYSPKGWPECVPILKRLTADKRIEFTVWEDVPFRKCMEERRYCHIILDEVITGSYHRCTLEACSHGQVALNGIDKDVRQVLARVTGGEGIGWVRTSVNALEDSIMYLVEHPRILCDQMLSARRWAEEYWDPHNLWGSFYEPALRKGAVV
jgi:hypothetical protein